METHSRAPKGGAVGANGEWYEGGKFIATTDAAKRHKIKSAATRRVQIGNNEWVQGRDGLRPLWPMLAGVEIYSREFNRFTFNPNLRGENYASADAIDYRKAQIAQFNEGKRWKAVASYDFA